MEKLALDLLLGLKFAKLEILSTSFINFLYDKLGECDIITLQTFLIMRERETAAVRTCANFQIASTTESEDREV